MDENKALEIVNAHIALLGDIISNSSLRHKQIPNWKEVCKEHISIVINTLSKGYEYEEDEESLRRKNEFSFTLIRRGYGKGGGNITYTKNLDNNEVTFSLSYITENSVSIYLHIYEDHYSDKKVAYFNFISKPIEFSTYSIDIK